MEHNAIQWLGAPSCQRGSYAFYKSVSSRAQPEGPVQVWKLGEFYFIRCGPQDPVCIAEVTLLWEDQTRRHLLASARLYFLPEDTPKGRTSEHGEDEVLAVSRKMVVRVEDLVRWACAEPADWSSTKLPPSGINGLHKPLQSSDGNSGNDKSSEPVKDKTKNDLPNCHGIKVLSYPQYCRFRSLQRRIQDRARGPGLQDPHLLALGGVKVLPNTRLMYCRDTFNHPTLESSASFSWQFRCPSLSLRGRPRKRRGRDGKDSPNSSQSESWIEKMKENVMGSVEVGCEGSWLPHPEEQLFLDQLFAYMERLGSPIHKVPNLGFKKIDLFLMYSVVKRLGGYKKVTLDRLWKVVYNELGGCPGSTSAATCTRRHYERLMLPYEEHLRAGGAEFKVPESPMPPKPRGIRGRKPLQRGRKPGLKAKDKKMTTPAAPSRTIVNPNGTVVVKRGRGRPPGTRNKATLIAQAKLLAQQQAKAKAAVESQQQSPLLPVRVGGGPTPSSTHRPVQPAVLPVNMPLTPDLSPMTAPFLPFQPKPKELRPDRAETVAPAPGVLLSTLPRHFVGGSLGGFSPIKGVCPLDVFRNRISLQRGPESPALTPQDPTQHHPTIYTLQPKVGSPDASHPSGDQLQPQPHMLHQQHNRCSGCTVDEAAQRGGSRDVRNRPPLPPLRVLPLNLDCSVQVCQLMRTRLGSSQFQTFTRRLSEALSQDLSTKPPCSPITPPPEQALPLNLSKRFTAKRPSTEGPEPSLATINGSTDQPPSKRQRPGCTEQAEDFSLGGRSSSVGSAGGGEQDVEMKNQEEPADLSSPSRIRAFLLGLPPFQVKFEEDLNGTRFGKFLPPGSMAETQRTETETGEGRVAVKKEVKKEEEVVEIERCDTEISNKLQKPEQEEKDPAHLSGSGPVELKIAGPSNTDTHCF
ncbi:AT-rich interactive domain-containing protein 5B [Epinephelus fuscoguttatus]|uniref:AT-rich interactive domain-containing protein 5B n=1 Tax=Epinephelus fuscoguttatus TaxID=293821 RepID=UPI0020D0E9E2|nr:AT-rich interactive domain-containing protein 5B [Epinephelus fuscoguttatus]